MQLEYLTSPVKPSTTVGGARKNMEQYQRQRQADLERKQAPAPPPDGAALALHLLREKHGYQPDAIGEG